MAIIYNKVIDLHFIKFPILFPALYLIVLFTFPHHGDLLAFATLMLLAEPHFGSTWSLFFDPRIQAYAASAKNAFVYGSFFVVLLTVFLFFLYPSIFFLMFFIANIFHVTRQSTGIVSLFSQNLVEKKFQKLVIYLLNTLLGLAVIFYLMIPVITPADAKLLGISYIIACFVLLCWQFHRYKSLSNCLTTATGVLCFAPALFVDKAIHAIIAGVTMHYSQYIALTFKVHISKSRELSKFNPQNVFLLLCNKYTTLIIAYGVLMSSLTIFAPDMGLNWTNLILIPIIGQALHFYLDGLLWRFNVRENREFTLKYIFSPNWE